MDSNHCSRDRSHATDEFRSHKLQELHFHPVTALPKLGYTYGAALENPHLRLPLGALALLAHLSQVRSGKHYR